MDNPLPAKYLATMVESSCTFSAESVTETRSSETSKTHPIHVTVRPRWALAKARGKPSTRQTRIVMAMMRPRSFLLPRRHVLGSSTYSWVRAGGPLAASCRKRGCEHRIRGEAMAAHASGPFRLPCAA